MENLDKELNELKVFIADLKADRFAQKEKEKREAWTKYTSMSIVFIAVLAAIATQWSGKYSSRTLVELNNSTFFQAKASDAWGEFQANSIKRNLYETVHDLALKEGGTEAAKKEDLFRAKIDKYVKTQDEKKAEANDLLKMRDASRATATDSSQHGSGMGSAVAIFQISIALGSICLVTKKKWLWYLSLTLAGLATYKMIQVWMNWPNFPI